VSAEWQLVLNESSVEFLLACKSRQRNELIKGLQHLKEDPHQQGEFEGRDSTGRPVHLKIIGSFIVTFWQDTFVREMRIIRIETI